MTFYAKERAILLDRDGTVIEEKNYLSDPAEVVLLANAAGGLRLLRDHGFRLVLVTNQSGIGRGMFTAGRLGEVHDRLRKLLAAEGVELDAVYVCPHAPQQDCDCRKPLPKLAFQAAGELGFDLHASWVIGDKAADVELARNCGAHSALVRTGYGRETEAAAQTAPDVTADDLLSAAKAITAFQADTH